MFKFFNKKKEISTKTMTDNEYIAAIEGNILPYWNDDVVCKKIGVKSLFESGAHVKNKLSIEDAKNCVLRMTRMVNIGTYVTDQFREKSAALRNDKSKTSEDKAAFYNATTIKNLFIEAQQNVEIEIVDDDRSCENIIKGINTMISMLPTLKDGVLHSTILAAMLDKEYMRGFD